MALEWRQMGKEGFLMYYVNKETEEMCTMEEIRDIFQNMSFEDKIDEYLTTQIILDVIDPILSTSTRSELNEALFNEYIETTYEISEKDKEEKIDYILNGLTCYNCPFNGECPGNTEEACYQTIKNFFLKDEETED